MFESWMNILGPGIWDCVLSLSFEEKFDEKKFRNSSKQEQKFGRN